VSGLFIGSVEVLSLALGWLHRLRGTLCARDIIVYDILDHINCSKIFKRVPILLTLRLWVIKQKGTTSTCRGRSLVPLINYFFHSESKLIPIWGGSGGSCGRRFLILLLYCCLLLLCIWCCALGFHKFYLVFT
jgi:hypothetical protein